MAFGSSFLAELSFNFSTLPSQLANGILLGAIYALVALGYTMVYGVLRLINFAHGEVYMLGAYVALFVTWMFGYRPGSDMSLHGQGSVVHLAVMLVASMVVCAIIGMIIEFFAYRPMRSQPRIAALITAIGVSLLLQYGGQLVLPTRPQPTITESVNPYRESSVRLPIVPAKKELQEKANTALANAEEATKAWEQLKPSVKDEYNLTPDERKVKDAFMQADRTAKQAQREADTSGVMVILSIGQIAILAMSIVLMIILRTIVLKTKVGRAMRAVSHDFDTAGLMGINVGAIITLTFVIGSALAGAGAMMTATFMATSISPFYGVLPGIKAFVAAVLGGIGNIPGAVVGGLLMGIAESLVKWVGYSAYADAVAFVVLIIVLLFRPGGLMGSDKVEKV